MLIHLLADFSRDPKLQERFQCDPHGVIDEYLDAETKQQVMRGDLGSLNRTLHNEVASLMQSPVHVMMPWPSPSGVTVSAISPSSGAAGTTVKVTITGASFDSGATAVLKNPSTYYTGANTVVTGGTTLTCDFTLPAGSAGLYDVWVRNPDNTAGVLTQGFTVTA